MVTSSRKPDAAKLRRTITKRQSALDSIRSSWESHWRQCSEVILPRKGRFLWTDQNRGGTVNQSILDNTPNLAARTLTSGLMSGLTSPANPWFKLVLQNDYLSQSHEVRVWLETVEETIRQIFARSNVYQSLHSAYEELGVFGTAAIMVYKDFDSIIHTQALTAGQYWLAENYRNRIDTIYRRATLTVAQIVEEFAGVGPNKDWSNISLHVKNLYENGDLDKTFPILHAVEPNPDYAPGVVLSWKKRFRSVWLEEGGDQDKILRHSGFDHFPALCPRWHPTPGDVYGRSCGMDALEDARQLQAQQRAKQRGIEKMVDPPLNAPAGSLINDLPGGINFYDIGGMTPPMASPLYQVQPRLAELAQDMEEVRNRVRNAFFADLFLLVANDDRSGITATEIQVRREEKMTMLGPVLEQLHHELLDPLIDLTFAYASEMEILPSAPEEIQGEAFRPQYISVLSQAQRLSAAPAIERGVGFIGNIAQSTPEVLDIVDIDETVRTYWNSVGAPEKGLLSPDDVDEIRQQRAEQQQQQREVQQVAEGAELLADVTDRPNALTELMQGL